MIDLRTQRYAALALAAAALFGASTPLAKLLLGDLSPAALAGLVYLGSGAGLLAVLLLRSLLRPRGQRPTQAPLGRRDMPWLAGAVGCGGVAAPILLFWGLQETSGSGASLLLNLEGVLTTLVAGPIFGEAVGRRVWLASFIMLAGGLLISYDPHASFGISISALAVVAACLFWAVDNNLTRRISGSSPVMIATIKGLAAGSVNLVLAYGQGHALPGAPVVLGAMALGLASYGVSLVLFIYALRHLGAARTSAHFGTAPFLGAILSLWVLGEPVTGPLVAAFVLMLMAVWLVLTEQHAHEHTHEPLGHAHRHVHDEHHRHDHDAGEGAEPHTHYHVHERLVHSHGHLPDLHHRHKHER